MTDRWKQDPEAVRLLEAWHRGARSTDVTLQKETLIDVLVGRHRTPSAETARLLDLSVDKVMEVAARLQVRLAAERATISPSDSDESVGRAALDLSGRIRNLGDLCGSDQNGDS